MGAVISIRTATEPDLPAINDLYNATIRTTTTAWTETPSTIEERAEWLATRRAADDAVLVAERSGAVQRIVDS